MTKTKFGGFLLQESTFPCIITRELYFSRERLRKMTTYLTWPETGKKYRWAFEWEFILTANL